MGRILICTVTLVGVVVLGLTLPGLFMPGQVQLGQQSVAVSPDELLETAAPTPRSPDLETAAGDTTEAATPTGTPTQTLPPTATLPEIVIAPPVPSPSAPPPPTSTVPPAPTDTPAATSTPVPPSPTATPSPSPEPEVTATEPPAVIATEPPDAIEPDSSSSGAAELLRRVADAEERLRAGEFAATITYSGGSRSVATIRFNLGDETTEPRLHIMTTYSGTEGVQVTERIVIGDQLWQRESNGPWSAQPTEESVWDQIQAYLPHAALVSNAERGEDEQGPYLEWYDEGRNTQVRLHVGVASGLPLVLRQSAADGGTTFTVIYRGWNVLVTIEPPSAD